jgi:hypothetical protein
MTSPGDDDVTLFEREARARLVIRGSRLDGSQGDSTVEAPNGPPGAVARRSEAERAM